MRLLRLFSARPSFFLFLLLVLTTVARVSADSPNQAANQSKAAGKDQNNNDNNQPTPSVAPSVVETTASPTETTPATESTSTSTPTAATSTTTTTTSESTTSTTPSPTTTTTSMDTTTTTSSSTSTTSTSTTTSTSSTTSSGPMVTIPPTANAPYMQTTSMPEGTVFIAVGAILGFIGLAVLAWRGMVAWSVNRSVRRAAMAQSSENKRLLRDNRKKRSTVYTAAPAGDVSLEKLGPSARSSVKPSRRGPSSNSGLFFSPTAGHTAGAHNAAGNRGSTYLPAGYYAAAGNSTPARSDTGGLSSPPGPGYPQSSPNMPPTGAYHDSPHGPRSSYVAASTSSLNLNQPSQGRAPSAYLEDLFESHAPPRKSESGRR